MNPGIIKQRGRRRAITVQMLGGYLNSAIIIIQGFLLIPLYLNFIGDRVYGLWLATGGVLAWLGFMDLGLGGILIQRVSSAYGLRDYDRTTSFFFNGFLIFCILDTIFLLLVYGLSFFIPGWFGAVGENALILKLCFQIAGLAAAAELMSSCLRGFAMALQRPSIPMTGQFIFRISGLAVTISLLFQGYKLWSIPIGLLVISIPSLVVNGSYAIFLFKGLGGVCKIHKTHFLDLIRLGPALFSSKLGNAMVSGIEPTLITMVFSPEFAPAFVITRRAADMLNQLLLVIITSISPGIAHLYAEGDTSKFKNVITTILIISFGVAAIGYSSYMAANHIFIKLWTGADQFLGSKITLCMALGLMTLFIKHLLFKFLIGIGDIKFPSLMNLFEAVIRVLVMVILLHSIGLIGLPLGMLLSCTVFVVILWRRFIGKMSIIMFPEMFWHRLIILLAVVLVSGYATSLYSYHIGSWGGFGLYLCATVATLSVITFIAMPQLWAECLALFSDRFKRY